jgi:hypothetical protein
MPVALRRFLPVKRMESPIRGIPICIARPHVHCDQAVGLIDKYFSDVSVEQLKAFQRPVYDAMFYFAFSMYAELCGGARTLWG